MIPKSGYRFSEKIMRQQRILLIIWRCGRRRSTVTGVHTDRIRPAAVAGSFYPADPARLDAEVARLVAQVSPSGGAAPKALIAPHAGYAYSGAVAASAFAQLREHGHGNVRVIVIGPAHYLPLR